MILSGTLQANIQKYTSSNDTYYRLNQHAPVYRNAHLRGRVQDDNKKKQGTQVNDIIKLSIREQILDDRKCVNRAVQQVGGGTQITKVVVQNNGVEIELTGPTELKPLDMM